MRVLFTFFCEKETKAFLKPYGFIDYKIAFLPYGFSGSGVVSSHLSPLGRRCVLCVLRPANP